MLHRLYFLGYVAFIFWVRSSLFFGLGHLNFFVWKVRSSYLFVLGHLPFVGFFMLGGIPPVLFLFSVIVVFIYKITKLI